MEEDLHGYKYKMKSTELAEERLKEAIDKASEKLKYDSAHDEELLHALSIVNDFIKRKKRVCYGGTAMNAILPDSKKFYDPEVDLPDYDFYTPDIDNDVEELVKELEKEGFKEIYHKVGIHEGTKKILVNFVPIADITSIDKDLFTILYRRSIVKDGTHYTDENILRMMMYLELSRPKGMVGRWPKVFERLQLINSVFPIRGCSKSLARQNIIPMNIRRIILNYIIEWKRILCNGSLIPIYKRGIRKRGAVFRIEEGGPALFTSPDPKLDAIALKKNLGDHIHLRRHPARGEIVPERIELQMEGKTICMIVQEIACHSYTSLQLGDKRTIYIGSIEYLITLYLALSIFTSEIEHILGTNVLCQVSKLIQLSYDNYVAKKSQFPAFSTQCRGHQIGFASLLREKFQRVQREKDKTRKRSVARKSVTRSKK